MIKRKTNIITIKDAFALYNMERKAKGYHNRITEYTDERRQKISRSMMGNSNGRNGGKATKGMHWYTNGVVNTKAFECPEGFWNGMTIYH
jgi:hypothetical protein